MSSNPISSSPAVKLRGISTDFSEIGDQIEEQDLGTITAEALTELLKKFAAIDPVRLVESDPEILLSGRRGRFTVRSNQGKLNLRETGDSTSAFQEIPAEAIAAWLDEPEGTPINVGTANPEGEEQIITEASSSRTGLVVSLLILSLIALGTSIYFTYQSEPIDNPKDYTAITDPDQIASINQMARGRFVNEDGTLEIHIEDGRRIVLVEIEIEEDGNRYETTDLYTPMRDIAGDQVLFSDKIGVIKLLGEDSLHYYADTYTRVK